MSDYVERVIMKYSELGAAEDIAAYRAMEDYHCLQAQADHRLELLKEGLEATKMADGHWSDRVRWITWVGKVEKELAEENK